jgi:polysaccharide biosynthesis transport protein
MPDSAALDAPRIHRNEGSLLHEILTNALRSWRGLVLWFCICAGAAIAYVLLVTPQFVATTQVVLERRQPPVSVDSAASSETPTLDSAQADSQVQMLQSERNLRYVFDTLDLDKDPDFSNGFSLIGWLQGLLPIPTPPVSPKEQASRAREIAYENFANSVTVKRLGQSYTFEVSYRAFSPKKAMRLANSITAAYIRDRVIYNIAAAAAQRGGDYLQNRISDSKIEQNTAESAVRTGVIPDYTFGHADARIISAAIEPLTKSYPMTTVILLQSAVFALITGVGAIVVREDLGRTIRSREQVARLTGIDVFAVVPKVPKKPGRGALSFSEALDEPASPFAQAMRALRTLALTAASGSHHVSVGVVSCHPREGRSSIAANVANLIAVSGHPVTLVDADFHNPTLTKALAPNAVCSLSDLAMTPGADASALPAPINSTLSFVPAVTGNREHDPNLFVFSRETLQGIKGLTSARDVIVDLPPLSHSIDAVAVGRMLTGVIVVAALHKTRVDDLVEAVQTLNRSGVRVRGIILNEAGAK